MRHTALRCTRHFCAVALIAAAPATTTAWTDIHRGPDHNARIDAPASVTDLTAAPAWVTGEENLRPGCRPILGQDRVYTVAIAEDPEDRVWIKAFDRQDGTLLAESGDLDVGSFVSFDSRSAPAYDPLTDSLFFNSGSTVYSLDGITLATNWSTTLDAANTDSAAGAMYSFINASPAHGAGRVFVKTYDSAFGVEGSQVVALDAGTGEVDWYARTGGRGVHSPLFMDHPEAGEIVLVEYQSTPDQAGFAAFAADGNGEEDPLWTTAWTAATGSGFHGLWGDLVTDGEFVYTVTSDFVDGRLVKFRAEDGALEYDLAAPGSDIPPILAPEGVFVLHGDGTLRRYSAADGTEESAANVASFLFRNYPAFMEDGFYLALPGEGLLLLGLDGAELSLAPGFTGAVTVDGEEGSVYIGLEGGGLAKLEAPTRVHHWEVWE